MRGWWESIRNKRSGWLGSDPWKMHHAGEQAFGTLGPSTKLQRVGDRPDQGADVSSRPPGKGGSVTTALTKVPSTARFSYSKATLP